MEMLLRASVGGGGWRVPTGRGSDPVPLAPLPLFPYFYRSIVEKRRKSHKGVGFRVGTMRTVRWFFASFPSFPAIVPTPWV